MVLRSSLKFPVLMETIKNRRKQLIAEANRVKNHLGLFPNLQSYVRGDFTAKLYTKQVIELNQDVKNWIFDLITRNMKEKYEDSWGWDPEKKLEELNEDEALYLIAESDRGQLLGYSHFRFDLEQNIEVLYCYELQLEEQVQRKGLGRFMMEILETLARKNKMKKVVLTVLKNNPNNAFFKSLNYELDESSPEDTEDFHCPYEILCKKIRL